MQRKAERYSLTSPVVRIFTILACFLLSVVSASPQSVDLEGLQADENFRWGVVAYHSGFYNDAIESFEKALSHKPNRQLSRIWLGRALYRAGFEEQALTEWRFLAQEGMSSPLISKYLEIVGYRRSLTDELPTEERFVIYNQIDSEDDDYFVFKRPTSVRARDDGSFYMTSYGMNEVLLIDANSRVIDVIKGDLLGFQRPFDVLMVEDDFLFVSEYGANRISKCTTEGQRIASFGEKGTGPGQLLGPQFLASDEKGYLYVTDYGNRRVSKFDFDGGFILSFGNQTAGYPGLSGPTGIAVKGETVFVADRWKREIVLFDTSGNYLGRLLGPDTLAAPEGLTFRDDHRLLIADTTRILEYDLTKRTTWERGEVSFIARRLMNVTVDANGNLITADFDSNRIFFLTDMKTLHTGFFVQIDRIVTDSFPKIVLNVSVTDPAGNPVVGLGPNNFTLSEYGRPLEKVELHVDPTSTFTTDVILLIEKSQEAGQKRDDLVAAVDALRTLFQGDTRIKMVSAGRDATIEAPYGETRLKLLEAVRRPDFTEDWRLDRGVRFAASELIDTQSKRIIVFLTQGGIGRNPYGSYSAMELAQYMRNNGIRFLSINMGSDNIHPDIDYLCRSTGGRAIYYYAPEGVGGILRDIDEHVPPRYILSYKSSTDSDFGRRYIQLEVSTTLQTKSGYDESGYFAPITY